jgi:hypothetical protein
MLRQQKIKTLETQLNYNFSMEPVVAHQSRKDRAPPAKGIQDPAISYTTKHQQAWDQSKYSQDHQMVVLPLDKPQDNPLGL